MKRAVSGLGCSVWLLSGGLGACDDREPVNLAPAAAPDAVAATPGDVAGDAGPSASFSGIARENEPMVGGVAQADLAGQRLLEHLTTECSSCHSEQDQRGGLGSVTDFAQLIELGWIAPGSSSTSPLFQMLMDDRMPPATVGHRARLSVGELATVARFIDALPVDVPECEALTFVSTGRTFEAIAADLEVLAAEDRPFARYATLTGASNAGLCGPALERQRQALFEALNSTSSGPDVIVPHALDTDALIYRIDTRNYGWQRALDLDRDGEAELSDAWDAAVAATGKYEIEYAGPQADSIKASTGTRVPVLPAPLLVRAVSAGDLYYALIGVPRSLAELGLARGVDIGSSAVNWAGFGGNQRDVRAVRGASATSAGAYWEIEDSAPYDAESFYDTPLEFDGGPHQVIFNLPNGLQAYAAGNGYDDRLSTSVPDHRHVSASPIGLAACHGCHDAGLLPMRDALRDFAADNALDFDPDALAAIQAQYLPAAELDALIESDGGLQRAALASAIVPTGGPNPLWRVYAQFELEPLTARRAAGEFGVPLVALRQDLGLLDPVLSPLGAEGTVDRATFTRVFHASVCLLHATDAEHPLGCP